MPPENRRLTETGARSRLAHPGWALLLASAPLGLGLFRGPARIDDAHITFRYAENLARGRGFVFNAEPMLGATAPFYCLLLAFFRWIGAAPANAAFAIGVVAAALTPVLLWRIGIAAGRPEAGLLGGLLLSLSPDWWLNAKTGMETTLAGMLLSLVVLLDQTRRPALSGGAAGLLVLTRPDAAGFPLLLAAKQILVDRRWSRALRFAAAGVAVLLPWTVYATIAIGSPLPHSLTAKQLIHPMPAGEALARNFGWLTGVRGGSVAMLLLFLLWLGGVFTSARSWRAGLPFVVWPAVSLVALSLLGIGPFFWYRIPLLPAVALGAGLGFESLRAAALRARLAAVAAALLLLPAAIVALQVAGSGSWLWKPRNLDSVHAKETALAEMAEMIRERARAAGRDPSSLTIYVGEVGVMANALLDARIIDSSGINSREVFELRRRDQERLRSGGGVAAGADSPEQSAEWSREVIRSFHPDFIATDERYLHLPELIQEPWVQAQYRPIRRWTFPNRVSLILLERASAAAPPPGS